MIKLKNIVLNIHSSIECLKYLFEMREKNMMKLVLWVVIPLNKKINIFNIYTSTYYQLLHLNTCSILKICDMT